MVTLARMHANEPHLPCGKKWFNGITFLFLSIIIPSSGSPDQTRLSCNLKSVLLAASIPVGLPQLLPRRLPLDFVPLDAVEVAALPQPNLAPLFDALRRG